MNKLFGTVSAVVLAAGIAGALTIIPSLSDRVDASAPITATDKCAEQHWPYMDADCLRDTRKAAGQAKPAARVVNVDRKMAAR